MLEKQLPSATSVQPNFCKILKALGSFVLVLLRSSKKLLLSSGEIQYSTVLWSAGGLHSSHQILWHFLLQVRTSAHEWIAQFKSSLPKEEKESEEKESEENQEVGSRDGDQDAKKSVEVTE